MERETSTAKHDIEDYLAARGGPFYKLQIRLGLLQENAFRAPRRAMLFVALTWGIPLLLSILEGSAFGPSASKPYLLATGVWARFFIAVGLFILMERQVEERLRVHLRQFTRAPLLAPSSFAAAAEAVLRALHRRDNGLAELICLVLACLISGVTFYNAIHPGVSSWAVTVAPDGPSLTLTAWWCILVSSPIFWFLLLRWLWRLAIWALLLRDIAGLELRLVATHPDGHGGLAFIGQYPNAFISFVFAISCVMGAAIANELSHGTLATATYGYIMAGWLLIVLALFTLTLLAFHGPLSELKERTLLLASSQATRYQRAGERQIMGTNMSAPSDADSQNASDLQDASKLFAAARSLSVSPVNRAALLPLSVAALLPLMAAGTTQLPIKELFKVMKRLLLL